MDVKVIFVPLMLLGLWGCALPLAADETRPNVLFIAVDDLRPEIHSFGHEAMVTPNLDRLATEGVRFTQAYCNIATCGASRATLMTSLRPTPDRFRNYLTRVDQDAPHVVSLPALFKQHGYTTLSNGKIYHHLDDDLDAWSEPPWRPENRSISWAKPENQPIEKNGRRINGPAFEAADMADDIYPDYQICNRTLANLGPTGEGRYPFFSCLRFLPAASALCRPTKILGSLSGGSNSTCCERLFSPRPFPSLSLYVGRVEELSRYP